MEVLINNKQHKERLKKMIIIRHLDNNKNEGDQLIFCNESCYLKGKEKFYDDGYNDNYNLYSNEFINHDKFDGIFPCIEESFLSTESNEHCYECEKLLNNWVKVDDLLK